MSADFVRPAVQSDIGSILTCTYAQWRMRVTDESYLPPLATVEEGWQHVLGGTTQRGVSAFVATTDNQVVGWLLMAPSTDADIEQLPAIEILDLLVHPEHHRKGHGSRLIHAAVDAARRQGFAVVSTWCLQINEHLREFLSGQGFGPDGAFRDLAPPLHDADMVPREFRLLSNIAPEVADGA
jgi:GNAT superfamily N-acetyltransferase